MARIKYLFIHCSDTPPNMEVTGQMIKDWHTLPPPRGRGWKKPGYTKFFKRDGTTDILSYNNNDEWITTDEITNGAAGYNGNSIHLCLAGGRNEKNESVFTDTPGELFTNGQIFNLLVEIRDNIRRFPWIKVIGHYQVNTGKKCPGFNVPKFLKSNYIPNINIQQ